MNLTDYLARERGAARRLAKELNCHVKMLYPWANGRRPCPPLRCLAIERATAGVVTRRELRPNDWADLWPELAQQQQAPAGSLPGLAGAVAAAQAFGLAPLELPQPSAEQTAGASAAAAGAVHV